MSLYLHDLCTSVMGSIKHLKPCKVRISSVIHLLGRQKRGVGNQEKTGRHKAALPLLNSFQACLQALGSQQWNVRDTVLESQRSVSSGGPDTLYITRNQSSGRACWVGITTKQGDFGGIKKQNSLFTHASPALQRRAAPCRHSFGDLQGHQTSADGREDFCRGSKSFSKTVDDQNEYFGWDYKVMKLVSWKLARSHF